MSKIIITIGILSGLIAIIPIMTLQASDSIDDEFVIDSLNIYVVLDSISGDGKGVGTFTCNYNYIFKSIGGQITTHRIRGCDPSEFGVRIHDMPMRCGLMPNKWRKNEYIFSIKDFALLVCDSIPIEIIIEGPIKEPCATFSESKNYYGMFSWTDSLVVPVIK